MLTSYEKQNVESLKIGNRKTDAGDQLLRMGQPKPHLSPVSNPFFNEVKL